MEITLNNISLKIILGFLWVFLILFEQGESNENRYDCLNPNGKLGRCKLLDKCPSLYSNALQNAKNNFDFTSDSICAWYTQPIVCCTEDRQYSEEFKSSLEKTECGNWPPEKFYPPWISFITTDDGRKCHGVLITPLYILTKYACVKNKREEKINVTMGECNLQRTENCNKVKVIKVRKFPAYNLPFADGNDVALLLLEDQVTEDLGTPVCLEKEILQVNQEVKIHMFNVSDPSKSYKPFFSTDLKASSRYDCQSPRNLTDREFCTGLNGTFCKYHYANGAPIMSFDLDSNKWYLVGMTKYCTWETLVSERISSYYKWIVSNIA